ncbi:hypothetical protein BP6252_07333 [Coleophoma cylindrospora]|uniref:Uncharacterized protein n=1 Tax=Coleophoma cylindrospora TaxID=1849047 RepID=A0A3D8RHJ7_9HELO|nr:hypothetical protein BP6252_07333 [Coleophoma cylindrospora]
MTQRNYVIAIIIVLFVTLGIVLGLLCCRITRSVKGPESWSAASSIEDGDSVHFVPVVGGDGGNLGDIHRPGAAGPPPAVNVPRPPNASPLAPRRGRHGADRVELEVDPRRQRRGRGHGLPSGPNRTRGETSINNDSGS